MLSLFVYLLVLVAEKFVELLQTATYFVSCLGRERIKSQRPIV